ncbi:MAG: hypothetical protein ACRC2V_09925 [Xenococcaceae cyanobacterium]
MNKEKENVKIEVAQEGTIAQMTIICQSSTMAKRMAKFLEKVVIEIDRESNRHE